MKLSKKLVTLLLGASLIASTAGEVLMCYYSSWAHYRINEAEVKIEHLDPNLCTHIIYSFIGLNAQGDVKMLDEWLEVNLKNFEKFIGLKKINPNVKLLAAIGGWTQRAENFSSVTGNPQLLQKFIRNIIEFIKKYKLDGIDLDWEFPGNTDQGGKPQDKQNFVELCKQLRTAVNAEKLLLTAAVGPTKAHRQSSYIVPEISKYLDYINIMAYDLHSASDKSGRIGQNAPLYASSSDTERDLNIDSIVQDWIKEGADPQKIVLGLGLYGRSYTLANPSNTKVGAQYVGGATPGQHTKASDSLAYFEICDKIKNDGWVYAWDDEQKNPYAYKGSEWVGYDDEKSLELKVDLVKKYKLAGVMVWSIEQDDVHNHCGKGPYPLMNAIKNRLGSSSGSGGGQKPIEVTTQWSTERLTSTTTSAPLGVENKADCSTSGFYADPSDCKFFYPCDGGVRSECGAGTKFDNAIQACNHAALVTC